MNVKLLTLNALNRALAWINQALQAVQRESIDRDVHVYRSLTGTAAKTSSPYYCSRWDVTDETISEYFDGMIVSIKIPVAGNSSYGTALQINSLGYKPIVYDVSSMIGTRYSVGSNIIAVYNATQTATLYLGNGSETITGCWQVMDYDANTIAYNIRTNNITRTVNGACYRYRICFSSADGKKWIAANHSTSTNATASRTVATEKIDPFGEIIYYNSTTAKSSGATLGATTQYLQYCGVTLGYSFNRTGSALVLTYPAPVYVKCTPQSDGSAIIDPDTPYTQTLPSTNDGKIYIYLGYAYSETAIDMTIRHPVYYHDGTKICLWTSASSGGASSLSGLTDTNIITPSNGQALTYDNTTSEWVNSDIPTEVFVCTLTISVDSENNNAISYSCDKTAAEIYAAYAANKSVILKTTGDDASEYDGPETKVIYRLDSARSGTGPNNNPFYFIFFKSQCLAMAELYKAIMPGVLGKVFYNLSLALFDGDLPTDLPFSAGWHFSYETFMISPNIVYGNLPRMDGNTISDSGIPATSVSTAVTNSHSHSNKTILDYIPSTLGTAGQALVVNDNATGLTFATVGGGGGLTDYDFTHTVDTTLGDPIEFTFAANSRGSGFRELTIDASLIINCNNLSDNYIWLYNSGSSDIDITIYSITHNLTTVSDVYMPEDGITVPAGKVCEIGVIVNSSGAFITCRNDIVLSS